MRVLVTRPQPPAGEWERALRAEGFEAEALPLLQIGPLADSSALQRVVGRLGDFHAVMAVSAAAARLGLGNLAAFSPAGQAGPSWGAIKTRAWATGPGTRAALLKAGVPLDRIDTPALDAGQFDSEALWQVVRHQVRPGQQILILRGAQEGDDAQGSGREWLAQQLGEAGVVVQQCAAYQRGPAVAHPQSVARARQAATDGTAWLFASSEAIATLRQWLPEQDWSRARAIATHARIAASARALGFGQVAECRADLASVAQTLRALA